MDRFYKNQSIENKEEFKDVVIPADSHLFKRPRTLSLKKLGDSLSLVIEEDIKERNVTSVHSGDQESNPTIPPNGLPIIEKTFISVDENYLYVWIPSIKKWKRTMISDWD